LKISKKVLRYIGIGIYVIALLVSGYLLFGKFGEQSKVDEELTLAEANLERTDTDRLSGQISDLEDQLTQITSQTDTMKNMMSQEIANVAASTIVFEIADATYVEVIDLNSLSAFSEVLEDIPCNVVPLEAKIEGNVEDLVSFVTRLNTTLTTGVIKSVKLDIPESSTGQQPMATISLLIYNYQD
jgi:Tfp pilus assembly protein PilO